jgi:hypothetical protein
MLSTAEPIMHVKSKNIPILMYHRISSDHESSQSDFIVSKNVFRQQMEYLLHHMSKATGYADF